MYQNYLKNHIVVALNTRLVNEKDMVAGKKMYPESVHPAVHNIVGAQVILSLHDEDAREDDGD